MGTRYDYPVLLRGFFWLASLFGCSLNYLVPVGSSECFDPAKTVMEKNCGTLTGLQQAFPNRVQEVGNQSRLFK
jgi:hypothetical protein